MYLQKTVFLEVLNLNLFQKQTPVIVIPTVVSIEVLFSKSIKNCIGIPSAIVPRVIKIFHLHHNDNYKSVMTFIKILLTILLLITKRR